MDEIKGDEQLARLYKAVKETGDKELRKELLGGIRKATKPLPQAIKGAARSKLPSSGGLASLIGRASITSRTRTTFSSQHDVGVRLIGQSERPSSKSDRKGKKGQEKPPSRYHDMAALDRGILRHPLFGNRKHWFSQDIEPGFWTNTINHHADETERAIRRAMDHVAKKLAEAP